MQYDVRDEPECRGRLRSAQDGSYSFRAIVYVYHTQVHYPPVVEG
jgi:hypothetical protein